MKKLGLPFFSFIIPNYNHAAFLEERIRSVLAQVFTDYELIILDDASTDQSREILESFRNNPKITSIIINPENSGSPFKQWKKGLSVCTGKWIWIAESDDVADPGFLEQMFYVIQKNPGLHTAYCDSLIREEDNNTIESRFSSLKNGLFRSTKWSRPYTNDGLQELNDCLKFRCTINNASAAVILRSAFNEHIDKILEFRYHGDWFLYILLALKGPLGYIPETLNTYRDHAGNDSKNRNYYRVSKTECFRILDFLLTRQEITDKKNLTAYFTRHYVGFGILKDRALVKNGIFWDYRKINRSLANDIFNNILFRKFKSNPLP